MAIRCRIFSSTYANFRLVIPFLSYGSNFLPCEPLLSSSSLFGDPYQLRQTTFVISCGLFIGYADPCWSQVATQEHIITQWTTVQTELATLVYPQIGSISSISETGEAVIDKLSTASSEGCKSHGPFSSVAEYFTAIAEAAVERAQSDKRPQENPISFASLGAFVFMDIVRNTDLFRSNEARFPLNHMDLGTQNILVDDDFNFLAVIDWEFAHTAPWQVNHFPMPFPLLWPDAKIDAILRDPSHIAYENVSRQAAARRMYVCKFRNAEMELRKKGRPLERSFADVLNSTASRIYACFDRLGGLPGSDEDQVREMVRLAFRFDAEGTSRYLEDIKVEVRRADGITAKRTQGKKGNTGD